MVIILSFPLFFMGTLFYSFEALNGGIEISNNFVLTCIIYFCAYACIHTYVLVFLWACVYVGV